MKLINASQPEQAPIQNIRFCKSFFQKGLGLMFKRYLGTEEGIILAERRESRLNTAIHMLFMNFDITVLWLDQNMVVVDKTLAKKWRLFYVPKKPAQFVVELHPLKYDNYAVGDKLILESE